MRELLGQTIQHLFISDDQRILVFATSQGDVAYQTEGDCCSETWFADITGVDALRGAKVTNVETVDMGDLADGRTRQEYDLGYGVNITTDHGYANIVYRNSSNGYYGGWIDLLERIVPRNNLQEITTDWST